MLQISVLEWGGIAFLSLWTLLIVLFQFAGFKKVLPWTPPGLLPNWSFFAPLPGTSDYHLLYRDQLANGAILAWREARPADRRWWMALWYPQSRETKALMDAIQDLALLISLTDLDNDQLNSIRLELTIPYLLLLNCVSNLPHELTAQATQFLVMSTPAFQEPEMLLLSSYHPLASTVKTGYKGEVDPTISTFT